MPYRTLAAIHVEPGKPMVIDEIEPPDPKPTRVCIRRPSTGVCDSQLHELHRPEPSLPLVLCHESTGVVTAVDSDVTHVHKGDQVMVTFAPRDATRHAPGRCRLA
jgi:S-(hydroxymethyl)glutathione dehydrogenase/alcohol dehydrogenase